MTGTIPPAASGYPIAAQRPPRPPLTRTAKVGAGIAGAVSFTVLNIGFVVFWLPILLGIIALVFSGIVRVAARVGGDEDADFRRFAEAVEYLHLEGWALPLVLVSVLGLGIMVLAVFASKWILTARGVARPWAVTWSGLGVAVVANSVIGGVFSGGVSLAPFADRSGEYGGGGGALITTLIVISVIVSIAVNVALGWLAMWWMAHALRPADAASLPPRHPRVDGETSARTDPADS